MCFSVLRQEISNENDSYKNDSNDRRELREHLALCSGAAVLTEVRIRAACDSAGKTALSLVLKYDNDNEEDCRYEQNSTENVLKRTHL